MKNKLILAFLLSLFLLFFNCNTKRKYISDFDVFNKLIKNILTHEKSIYSFYIIESENIIEVNSFLSADYQKFNFIQFNNKFNQTGIDSIYFSLVKLDFTGYQIIENKWIEFYTNCPLTSNFCYTIQYLTSKEEIRKKRKIEEYVEIDSNIFIIPNGGLAIE